jgi:ABC-type antimicrobial peptide transport system permease subunit
MRLNDAIAVGLIGIIIGLLIGIGGHKLYTHLTVEQRLAFYEKTCRVIP